MIDNLKAQKEFKEYVKNYNPEDEKIKIKISHIERVSQVAKNIASHRTVCQRCISYVVVESIRT